MTAGAAWLAICLAALLAGQAATAQEFRLHTEASGSFFVDDPQANRFTPGFYVAFRPSLALGRVVALQWSYAALMVPAAEGYDSGSAHFLLAGVRLRPFAPLQKETNQLGGLFVDVDAGYVRTGTLDRFGFDAGVGYGFQVAPWFSFGPALRYGQIVQPDNIPERDPNDAQFLTLGVDLVFGPPNKVAKVAEECPDVVECPEAAECPPEKLADEGYCPDFDRDGVCDVDDQCPTQIGPPATLGCPIDPCSGAPLVVLVQFDDNSAVLPPPKDDPQTMDPVLDAVAAAIAQDPSCRVCIVGHASEEGPDERNQELSYQRAVAVQQYLSVRGLATTRMPTSGMGSDCPLVPHDTRVLNRRVEFHRLMDGESCPMGCFPVPVPATKAAAK